MSAGTQPPTRDTAWEAELAIALEAALTRHACPGAALTVFDGERAALVACGIADVEDGTLVAHDTRFQIGSVTKPMTATLVHLAAAAGELDLEADLASSHDELAGFAGIAARQLLDHTSGISGDDYGEYGSGPDALATLVGAVAARPRLHEPREFFSYSNNSYAVLGRLLELCWGDPFATLIEERLFAPLGLATASASVLGHEPGTTAFGHVLLPGADAPRRSAAWAFPYAGAPAGSVVTMSAMDLARFGLAQCADGWLRETGRAMEEPSVPVGDGSVAAWGPGWCRFAQGADGSVLGHSGETRGQQAFLRLDPDARRVVALVTNAYSGSAVFADLTADRGCDLGWAESVAPPAADTTPPVIAGTFARYEAHFTATPVGDRLVVAHEYTGTQAAVSDIATDVSRFEPGGPGQWWTVGADGRPGQTLRVIPGPSGEVTAARLNLRLYRAAATVQAG